MEAKTNYTIVGIIVLFLASGLISAVLWLSVGFSQKAYNLYTVYLHEPASGLSEQAPVKYNGVQVGFVKAIKLNQTDPRQVELTLSIEEGTPVTISTTATLLSQGITGVTYVGLSAGAADLTPIEKMPGEPYPVIPAKPSLFNQLDAMLREVADNVNKLSNAMQGVFNEENSKYVRKTLANVQKVTDVFAENSKNLDAIIKDLKVGLVKFNNMATDLSQAGKNVSKTMVSGKNTINKISQQTIPEATLLMQRLNKISANLDKVSNQMRQNPSVVIRGTKPPKSGPGE